MRGLGPGTLARYLDALAEEVPAAEALRAALAPLADPWEVVEQGGALARCALRMAPEELRLDARLRVNPRRGGLRVRRGQRFPLPDPAVRKALGAWDTPRGLARTLVAQLVAAWGGIPPEALDPACGAGALLLAAAEAGVGLLRGEDLDPGALAVAGAAVPGAALRVADLFEPGPEARSVLCNPPFVRPERQDHALRARLTRRWPWLSGRFDLSVPALAAARERVAPGGMLGLVVPEPAFTQPYGAPLRRLWLEQDRLAALAPSVPFPGAGTQIRLAVLAPRQGPAPLPWLGAPSPAELLASPRAPLDLWLRAGDLTLAARAREAGPALGSLCRVDTGLVAHGPGGGKAALLHPEPGPGRVSYVDAADLSAGRRRYLDLRPDRMHRPKDPALFAAPKLLVQRLRGSGPLRVWLDEEGLVAGHTLTVVQPGPGGPAAEALAALLRHPLVRAWLCVERGAGLDLYPHDLAAVPVPRSWLEAPGCDLGAAWGLEAEEAARLLAAQERAQRGRVAQSGLS